MCELLNIGIRRDEEIVTPEFKGQSRLLKGVYNGSISPFVLPVELFEFSFFALISLVAETFGLPSDFKRGSWSYKRATQMKNNISIFSGAKNFQEVLELTIGTRAPNGDLIPFNKFKKLGLKIDDKYNVNWLETEQQASFRQAQSVGDWKEVNEDQDLFPYLEYSTVRDSRVRIDHAEQQGIIKRVDDPFWDTWFPPNGWNCRCIVKQLEQASVTKGNFETNPDKTFGTNVGKNGLIFPKEHKYFDVPKPFKKSQKRNFGFKTPSDSQIKELL